MLNEFRSTFITWDKATSRIYSPITANASDENGRKLVVQIVNSGQVEDLTGATLHLYWETRDKAHDGLDVFEAVDLKKGEFELSYTTGMLSNQGVLNANLVLIDTVGRVVSDRFKITVTEGIDNDAIQSENSFSSLTQALIDISNLEQNYAPRLNDLTAQLQQTTEKVTGMDRGYGGTYGTLSELQTAFPTGDDRRYVVSNDGNWYYWDGSAWTSGGVFQATGIDKRTVSMESTDFVEIGTNLFNNADPNIIEGEYIDSESATETLISAATLFLTGFVDTRAGEKITVPVVANVLTRKLGAFYDVNGNFLMGIPAASVVESNGVRTVTTPSNPEIRRVRFNGRNNINGGVQYRDTFMIVKGDVYPSEYVPYHSPKLKNSIALNDTQRQEVISMGGNSPLSGKVAAFLGDSISAGAGEVVRRGWAGRIGTKNGMDYTNYSVSGATIASETYSGSTPRTWLCRKVDAMRADAEYVILEGGINDHINNVPLGTITSDYVTPLDETTFCGAMESLLKQCIEKYVGKKIGFIIVYKIANEHYPYGATTPQAELYFDKVREICEKWSIPVLDLYKESGITVDVPAVKSALVPDGIHVNEQGYEVITPKIEAWMRML